MARHGSGAALLAVGVALWPPDVAADETFIADFFTGVVPIGAYVIAHQKDDWVGKDELFWSTGTTLVVNTSLRVAFNDNPIGERPNGHTYGFPSGHMSFIVSGAAFLQERYGYRYGIPAWLLSAYTGWVRVKTHHHHWRDIIAGAAVSYTISRYFVSPYETDVRVAPVVEGDAVGLRIALDW